MKYFAVFFVIILAYLFQSCASDLESVRAKEKFTRAKKYAVIPFNCQDWDVGYVYADAMRDWLMTYDYEVVDSTSLKQILAKNKLNMKDVIDNYACAIGKVTEVDGFVIGYIYYDKKSGRGSSSSAGSGGMRNFVDKCDAFVINLQDGDILQRANYIGDVTTSMTASAQAEEICKKLAQKLAAH
jgi:hypothetical protein